MLVNFNTIAGHAFKLDCDLNSTLAETKLKISNEKGSETFPVELQKLIYKGKVRGDHERLSDLKLDEDGDKKHIIITCQPSKTKPSSTEVKESANIAAVSSLGSETYLKADDDVKPAISNDLVLQIQDMGYTSEKAASALKISNGNVSEAVQYLILQESGHLIEDVKSHNEVSKSKVSFVSPLPDNMPTRKLERMKRFGLDVKQEVDSGQRPVECAGAMKDSISKREIVEKTLRSDAISPDVLVKRSERFKNKEVESDDFYAEKKKARLKRFGLVGPDADVLEKRAKRFASSEEVDLKVIDQGPESGGIVRKQVQEK